MAFKKGNNIENKTSISCQYNVIKCISIIRYDYDNLY